MRKRGECHLIVFGLRSLFESDLVADPHDTLVRLVQSGVRPLLAVSKQVAPIKKVLIACSGSMESAKAMKNFFQSNSGQYQNCDAFLLMMEQGTQTISSRRPLATCRAHGLETETECITGSPKDHLLPYMQSWGADLTVVGNSAQNLLLRRIFGETALHVIRNTDKPLFLSQ